MTRRRPPDAGNRSKFVYDEPAPGITVTPPGPNEPIPTYEFPEDDGGGPGTEDGQAIHSIGTSLHAWRDFEHLLRGAGIEVVIDVRSSPRSRLPHFNQSSLREHLAVAGMQYRFFGVALGGHPPVGSPDYELMAMSTTFLQAIDQLIDISRTRRIALMCSEHEPIACHRSLLIGRELTRRGLLFVNILRDGLLETHSEAEDRLLKATRQTEADSQASRDERLAAAYRLQNQRLNRLGARQGPPSGGRGSGSGSR